MKSVSRRRASRSPVDIVLWLVLLALAGATAAALAARLSPLLDIFSHFRVQYVIMAAVLAVAALPLRRWVVAMLALLCALPHLLALESLVIAPPAIAAALAGSQAAMPKLRLTTMNVAWDNLSETAALAYIKATRPDVLLLQEASAATHPLVRSLGALYPYRLADRDGRDPPPLLFSRYPILDHSAATPSGGGPADVSVKLDVEGTAVTVVGLHLNAPISRNWSKRRNRQLLAIARAVDETDGPVIVAGDFNITPWSPHFADFKAAAPELVDAARGRGWIPTWPVGFPPLRVPIDRIMVNEQVVVLDLSRGPDIGSDHFPLSAELAVRP